MHRTEKQQPLLLIVDDIPENLRLIGNIFRAEGMQIAIASDGKKALEIAQAKRPDLILLDVQMPNEDGFEICSKLKELPDIKDIPVLFLTAKTAVEDILRGFELGGVDYITKPFNQFELVARVKTHLELRLARKKIESDAIELQELIATKDKFFNIIAHDLKSPYSALMGFTEIIKNEAKTIDRDELQEYANFLYEAAEHSLKLVQNLLEWARLQTGKMKFEPNVFNLHDLTRSMGKMILAQAAAKNIEIVNLIPESQCVLGDVAMIDTVLRNITSNAIKFSNPNSKITIGSSVMKGLVEVTIADQGVGIPANVQERLFQLTTDYTTEGTANEKGTGLGLVLCHEILQKHDQIIWVESIEGEGTTIHFTLEAATSKE
ncbi:MAG: hybrid sensor histidine kinase/response regulator [Ignavibacteria bacterium]|nr:hybrid sensor histidine kinase/response regulator [Ignavibacteria bacterium]